VLLSEQQTLLDSVSTLSSKIKSLCVNNEQLQNQLITTISSLSEQAIAWLWQYKFVATWSQHQIGWRSSGSLSTLDTRVIPLGLGVSAIDEYMDRERRKSNLIVYGFPEASASTGLE